MNDAIKTSNRFIHLRLNTLLRGASLPISNNRAKSCRMARFIIMRRRKTMSKYMQLTVRVRSYHKKALEADYPKIAKALSFLNEKWTGQDLSLFDIAGRVDRLLYDAQGNPSFREILLKQKDTLRTLHKTVEAHIADWNLAEADKTLYQIEDVFDQIEWELG
jgi:hypothetical protein